MLKWISKLFNRAEETEPFVNVFERSNLRAGVTAQPRICGHTGYVIELDCLLEDGQWMPIGTIADFSVQDAVVLLQQAADFIGDVYGVRQLPTVYVRGKTYFVDDRLNELRSVTNPHDRVELCPVEYTDW